MTQSLLSYTCTYRDVSNLNAQQVSGIMEFLPTIKESRALQKYIDKENERLLCECEKFMVSMIGITDAQKKTQTMLFMLQFPVAINEIRSGETLPSASCTSFYYCHDSHFLTRRFFFFFRLQKLTLKQKLAKN